MLAAGLYTISGPKAEARGARAELRRLVARGYVDPGIPMRVYVNVGEKDRAFEWMEKAFAERSTALTSIKVNPGFDPLRSDPRFQDLLRRMNLPQ